jgi:hypothetical protein
VGDGQREGVVISLDHDGAHVLVEQTGEEWYFPTTLVPESLAANDVVVLQGSGRDVRIVGTDSLMPSVEARLQRGLNRRRFALSA